MYDQQIVFKFFSLGEKKDLQHRNDKIVISSKEDQDHLNQIKIDLLEMRSKLNSLSYLFQ